MRLERLSWPKIEKYFKTSDTVLMAVGSIECHGRHLALGTDTLIPEKLIELIEEKNDVLIVPTLPYGATEALEDFPGTISIGSELLFQVLMAITNNLFKHGARKFVILNGHGGNMKSIDRVGYELQRRGALLAELNWWIMTGDMHSDWTGGHGGGHETSAIMAIDTSLVDKKEIDDSQPLKLNDVSSTLKAVNWNTVKYKGINVNIPRLSITTTKNGWLGPDHPSSASVKWGQDMLQSCANYIVDFIEEFKKVDIRKASGGIRYE